MTEHFLPTAKSVPSLLDEERLNRHIARRNLVGLSNNTKWNELINRLREPQGWSPSWRAKTVKDELIGWDKENYYHLPVPMKSVLWFDIGLIDEWKAKKPIKREFYDYTELILNIVKPIGIDYEISNDILRIFGYSPKNYDLFGEWNNE
jgi:hypothetical protein